MTETNDSSEPHRRYAAAVLLAMVKHKDQTRREGTPYIVHPLRVAESLRTIGGVTDYEVILGAILHDLIEDTDVDYEELAERFGHPVATLVSELSADQRLPKEQRKHEMLERIRNGSKAARIVKLADRLDNITGMERFSESKKASYVRESRAILEACRGVNAGLERALEQEIVRRGG